MNLIDTDVYPDRDVEALTDDADVPGQLAAMVDRTRAVVTRVSASLSPTEWWTQAGRVCGWVCM